MNRLAFPKRRTREVRHCICDGCGATFEKRPWKRKRFCSTKCYYQKVKKAGARICLICGASFTRMGHLNSKTCSAKCGYEFRKRKTRAQARCKNCETLFWPKLLPNGW